MGINRVGHDKTSGAWADGNARHERVPWRVRSSRDTETESICREYTLT